MLERIHGFTNSLGTLARPNHYTHTIHFTTSPHAFLTLSAHYVDPATRAFIPLHARRWTLTHLSRPEDPRAATSTDSIRVNSRSVVHSSLATSNGDVLAVMSALGAVFHHEHVERGYAFTYQGVSLRVVRVGELPQRFMVSGARDVDMDGFWLVQVVGERNDEAIMRKVVAGLKGVVELVVVDHFALQQR